MASTLPTSDKCTLAELMEFILPGALTGSCPAWPPDVFAVAATLMRRTGSYVRCLATGGKSAVSLLDERWPGRAEAIGGAWRRAICAALKEHAGSGKTSLESALLRATLPPSVTQAWSTLCNRAGTSFGSCTADDALTRSLLELSGYADEASWSIGLESAGDEQDEYGQAAQLFLALNDKQSFCHRVHPQRARVLGKKHTPQQGLTLRSLTHHLSLCMPWEVEPLWFDLDSARLDDVLNLLLLPWPLEVKATDFQCVNSGSGLSELRGDSLFEYSRPSRPDSEVERWVLDAIERAKRQVSKLHAVVLPELALTRSEWKIAEAVAIRSGVMLISGIIDDTDDKSGLPMNSCRIQMMSLPTRPGAETVAAAPPPAFRQAKHHRWCLDRHQVLQYDLGGQLPSALRCWENSHIGDRRIFFAHLGGWLTFSVLICEDLARQDPIADVLRSVGPNLVIALLMDGPQLAARWPARYASVLADDPGSSVLTLTSLGMCQRSRPVGGGGAGSRVIALWKDKLYGTRELELPEGCDACVLSLARDTREEYTADGRSDGKATEVTVYSGFFPVPAGSARNP